MHAIPGPVLTRPHGLFGLLGLLCGLAGCAPATTDYYPLEPSRWWYYEVRQSILDEERESRYLMLNAGTGQLDGEAVYLQTAQSGSVDYLRRRGQGVERVAWRRAGTPVRREEAAHVILPERLEQGAAWRVRSTLGLIESRTFDPVDRLIPRRIAVEMEKSITGRGVALEVPAGSFGECLRIDGIGKVVVRTDRGNAQAMVTVHSSEWYAPGVGLVRLERSETSDSPFLKPGHQTWALADFGP